MIELDSRWDWIEVTPFGDSVPQYIRGACRHLEIVDVVSTLGEVIARLCQTCDAQLPGDVTHDRP